MISRWEAAPCLSRVQKAIDFSKPSGTVKAICECTLGVLVGLRTVAAQLGGTCRCRCMFTEAIGCYRDRERWVVE